MRESDVESVKVIEKKTTITLTSGRKIIFSNEGDYIEEDGAEEIGDDVNYYRRVRDLIMWF